ncbi:MAG: Fe-S cluster assembly protein SufD [Bacteroidales bacterium]|nr:Fe-S cluster assembly protein SufD [Bacteroidales bacterium]
MKAKTSYAQKLSQFQLQAQPDPYRPLEEVFKCQIWNLDTTTLPMLNGWYMHKQQPLTRLENGVVFGSLRAAQESYPEIIQNCHQAFSHTEKDELTTLNESQYTDGVFIYIPDDVKVADPFQIISVVNTQRDLLVQNRHVIYLGKSAEMSLIQCDDSVRYSNTFLNVVTEVYMSENAQMHYYKTENKEKESELYNHLYVHQKGHTHFHSNTVTFNAGYIRNSIVVNLCEPFADAQLYGLYLVDKSQQCDNHIKVNHCSTDCTSKQLYKGIMDDEAVAGFHGHVVVHPDAQRTAAFQTNRNILLTDKAKVNTTPFLEIYADDVQCSHGATVGQLDDEALFYLRSRGISEHNARKLLMFAFANEIIRYVEIDALQERLGDMVQRRLNGELTICDQCMLSDADNRDFVFPIDPSRI